MILVFCLFAGLIAETFVTDSSSPVQIVRVPFILPYNIVLYGAFDLLAREIIVRRRAGLASALLLGAAYGFINEGVVAGTWYVVRPPGYAFIGGIDWTWALSLTIFHTIFSVFVPIAFIEILFPSLRGQPLLRRWGMATCVALLCGCVLIAIVVAILVLAPLPLPLFLYRMSVLAVATLFSLIALALPSWRIPKAPSPTSTPLLLPAPSPIPSALAEAPTARRLPGLWHLRIAGFLAMVAYFILTSVFPALTATLLRSQPDGLIIAQVVDCAVLLAFSILVIWRGWSWSRRAGWSPRQNLALLLGGVSFSTLLLNLTEAPMGEAIVTLPFYALLIALTLRWRTQTQWRYA